MSDPSEPIKVTLSFKSPGLEEMLRQTIFFKNILDRMAERRRSEEPPEET